jgi:hypothetical protein
MPLTPRQRGQAAALRQALTTGSDEQLDTFLAGYSLGHMAGLLVGYMTPEQRLAFVTHLRGAYPEAFAAGTA